MLVFDAPLRPGRRLDHAERAVVLGDARLRVRACTRPAAGTSPPASPQRTTCCSGTAWPPSGCGRPRRSRSRPVAGRSTSASRSTSATRSRPSDSVTDQEAARRADGLGARHLPRPAAARRVPGGRRRRPGRAGRRDSRCATATWRSSARPSTCWASTTTPTPSSPASTSTAASTTTTACRSSGGSAAACRAPRWAGRSCPDGLRDLLVRLHRDYPGLHRGHHRERRGVRRRAPTSPASSPTTTAPPTSPRTSPPSRTRRRPAPTSGATSPGR